MKIVHIFNGDPINNSEVDGIHNVVYNLAIIQSKNYRVEICGITHRESFQQTVNSYLTFHNIKRNLFRTCLINYIRQNKLLFLERQVIFHLHNVYVFEYFFLVLYLKKANINWVLSPHSGYNPRRFNKKRIFNYFAKKIYILIIESHIIKNAFKIHATGPQEEIELQNLFPKKEIQFIPNGVNLNYNSFNPKYRRDNKIIIGFLGRFDIYQKGLDILMQSMKLIIHKNNDIRLHLIGYGADEIKLKEISEKLNLQNFVSFKGPQFGHKKFFYLNQLDYFIQLSRYESFPIAILEAASVGLPLMVSEGTGFKDVIVKYQNGIIIETKNKEKIAESVIAFINSIDESKYKTMSSNSIRLVKENYQWNKIVPKFSVSLYK